MSDKQHPLPGPRTLFPDLFPNTPTRTQGQQPSASAARSQPAAAAPAQIEHHGQTRTPLSVMLPPLATGTTGHTVSGQAQNTTPPSQPHATLRPAEWNDRNPSPPSPADKKRYACEVCDKRFERPSSLETHMNSHTGARPHLCVVPGCPKAFSTKSNMQRHLRTHHS